MKSPVRFILFVCMFVVTSALYAQLPSPDQVGLYAGKGTMVMNLDLDTAKLVKEPASYIMIVHPDGSAELQIIFEGGSPGAGMGEAHFGAAGAIYRIAIDSVAAAGRISLKGNGSKLKASGTVNLLLPGYVLLAEGTMKLKKITL